jgi:hypothetical protein
MEIQKIQKINSELRTVAAEELQRAIASELDSVDSMEEVELSTLLLSAENEKGEDIGDNDSTQ